MQYYEDERNNRLLLANGISIMDEDAFAEYMLLHDEIPESLKIPRGKTSETFYSLYGIDVGVDMDMIDDPLIYHTQAVRKNLTSHSVKSPTPPIDLVSESEAYSDRFDFIIDLIDKNAHVDRLDELETEFSDTYEQRIREEADYFTRNNHIPTLVALIDLVTKLDKDGVIWGTGRGSACASLVLYLLRVHDVNPLKYDIPFNEMTKESNSEY